MIESENWVPEEHLRTGKTHNLANLFPIIRHKTVNRTLGAGGFMVAQLAFYDTR